MLGKSGGNGSRTAKRAGARENKVPSKATLNRRAKKAREAAAADDYDNVGPRTDDIGESDIHVFGDADNDDVIVDMGAGSTNVGGSANAESLPPVDARAVLIWDITQLLMELLSDVKIAHGLLHRLRPSTSGNHPLLHSEQAKHWRQACHVHDKTSYAMSEVPCPFTTHYCTCCLGICATR